MESKISHIKQSSIDLSNKIHEKVGELSSYIGRQIKKLSFESLINKVIKNDANPMERTAAKTGSEGTLIWQSAAELEHLEIKHHNASVLPQTDWPRPTPPLGRKLPTPPLTQTNIPDTHEITQKHSVIKEKLSNKKHEIEARKQEILDKFNETDSKFEALKESLQGKAHEFPPNNNVSEWQKVIKSKSGISFTLKEEDTKTLTRDQLRQKFMMELDSKHVEFFKKENQDDSFARLNVQLTKIEQAEKLLESESSSPKLQEYLRDLNISIGIPNPEVDKAYTDLKEIRNILDHIKNDEKVRVGKEGELKTISAGHGSILPTTHRVSRMTMNQILDTINNAMKLGVHEIEVDGKNIPVSELLTQLSNTAWGSKAIMNSKEIKERFNEGIAHSISHSSINELADSISNKFEHDAYKQISQAYHDRNQVLILRNGTLMAIPKDSGMIKDYEIRNGVELTIKILENIVPKGIGFIPGDENLSATKFLSSLNDRLPGKSILEKRQDLKIRSENTAKYAAIVTTKQESANWEHFIDSVTEKVQDYLNEHPDKKCENEGGESFDAADVIKNLKENIAKLNDAAEQLSELKDGDQAVFGEKLKELNHFTTHPPFTTSIDFSKTLLMDMIKENNPDLSKAQKDYLRKMFTAHSGFEHLISQLTEIFNEPQLKFPQSINYLIALDKKRMDEFLKPSYPEQKNNLAKIDNTIKELNEKGLSLGVEEIERSIQAQTGFSPENIQALIYELNHP